MNILDVSAVKNGLKLSAISKLNGKIANAQKSKFDNSIELAVLVKEGFEWFKSEAGKSTFKANNVKWNAEDFALNVYGWKKSFFYRMVKSATIVAETPATLDAFNAYIEEQDMNGKATKRSLEEFVKFAENGIPVEGEGEGEGEESAEEAKVETIFTMSFKATEGKNVAVRVDANGLAITKNEAKEIADAIAFLQNALKSVK